MQEIDNLKKTILTEYPRLSVDDSISFRCGSDLACYNQCCADVNIFLTPYDVLRLRRSLKMDSAQFLAEHTIIPFDKNHTFPSPLLVMRDTEKKECPFVDAEKGCTVYEDRPWSCRIYPLGFALPNQETERDESPFYFLLQEDFCEGLKENRKLTVREWLVDQGVSIYSDFGDLLNEITMHSYLTNGRQLKPEQIEMYWTAMYDLDKFRRFIFESSFLERFDFSTDEIEPLRSDDESLLRFGFRWVKMALFGEKTISVNPKAVEDVRHSGIMAENV